MSTASGTVSSALTRMNENDVNLVIKTVVFTVIAIMFVSLCMSLLSMTSTSERCRPRYNEYFSTDDQELQDFQTTKFNYSNFASVPLTSPDQHLIGGQANRHVIDNEKVIMEIQANLYVLNGNVFGTHTDNTKQSYKAYLHAGNTMKNNAVLLGTLEKDGDGIYKLRVVTNDVTSILQLPFISIRYELDGNVQNILEGKFPTTY